MPMPRRSGGTTPAGVERVADPTRIAPSSGAMKPAIRRRSVVLPQPLGPSSVTNSRSRISRLRSATAVTAQRVLETLTGLDVAAGQGDGSRSEPSGRLPLLRQDVAVPHEHEHDAVQRRLPGTPAGRVARHRHWVTAAGSAREIASPPARPRPSRVARAIAAVMISIVTIASAATGPSAPVS